VTGAVTIALERDTAMTTVQSVKYGPLRSCACGCDELTFHVFAPGHNRRVQGRLLAAVAAGDALEGDLLALYTATLSRPPTEIAFNPVVGCCLAGCGRPTSAVFSPGCGGKFGDAVLAHLAGLPVQVLLEGWTMDQVVELWRQRQDRSASRQRKLQRHSAGQPARDSSSNAAINGRLWATLS